MHGRNEMPKIKTNRGAAKRFKTTGKGKIVRSKAFGNHILTKKTTKRKRTLRKSSVVDGANTKNVRRLIPYL
jgi:large subunit ribosomal protein L35